MNAVQGHTTGHDHSGDLKPIGDDFRGRNIPGEDLEAGGFEPGDALVQIMLGAGIPRLPVPAGIVHQIVDPD
jgi:hypothetical protein